MACPLCLGSGLLWASRLTDVCPLCDGSSAWPAVSSSITRDQGPCYFVSAISEPWLSHLVSGAKQYEGRLCQSGWSKLRAGDKVEAFNTRYMRVTMTVQHSFTFRDFDEAFVALGNRLLPEGATTPDEALNVYRQFHTAEQVSMAGGVVAVKLSVDSAEEVPCWPRPPKQAMVHITTADDLCVVLFRMFQSYHGLQLDLFKQMIAMILGRSWPETAFERKKLVKLMKYAPFSNAFVVKTNQAGVKQLCLGDVQKFDAQNQRLYKFAQTNPEAGLAPPPLSLTLVAQD